MKISKALTITAVALALSLNNFAMSQTAPKAPTKVPTKAPTKAPAKKAAPIFNVAIVDVQRIVDVSPKINSAKAERKNKLDDLAKFVENARTALSKEPNEAKKKSMEENYNKELNNKKNAIDKEYAKKLTNIDKEITELIKSKTAKYDLVLSKSSVLNGGTDITSEIVKGLK